MLATPLAVEGYYENTLKLLSMVVMSGNWWAPQGVAPAACAPEVTTICTNPGYMFEVRATAGGINRGPGKQRLRLQGRVFFPQGIPVAALDGGAQVLVEDVGAGNAAIYEISAGTDAIPPASSPACDSRDGWVTRGTRTLYRNRSTAVDVPACTPGSARGLRTLRYRTDSERDFSFRLAVRAASILVPVGPLRVSLVFGDTAAASAGGQCAVSATIPCSVSSASAKCASDP
jgi:hypothetical protein